MKKPQKKHYLEEDIFLVHKPVGISSFALVTQMRKILDTRKIGHAGTLDPLASGLMILGINKGTKKITSYLKKDKTYIADIIIGVSTTTGDREGEIVEKKKPYMSDLKQYELEMALDSLVGEHYYPAPLYSAVKVLGKPLYKYARENITPPFIPEKKMHLKRYNILDVYKEKENLIVRVRVDVGSGTYIRTLAEEFGKKLHYPASLKKLYRIAIGEYYDKDAYKINSPKKSLRLRAIIQDIFVKLKK